MPVEVLRWCVTLGIGIAGGALIAGAGMSGGWLLGAIIAVAGTSLGGASLSLPGWFRSIAMGFAGITVGAAVNADTIKLMGLLPWSLICMSVFLGLVVSLTYFCHRRLFSANRATAIVSAWPGNFLLIMAGAEATRADINTVHVIQSVRVVALMGILPLAVGMTITPAGIEPTINWLDLGSAGVIAGACILLARHLNLIGGEMFLTAFAVGTLSAIGALHIATPGYANTFFQVVVGCFIGLGLAQCSARAFAKALVPSFASALFAATATLAAAFAMSWWFGYPLAALALALAPGGAEAMILLAAAFEVDPAFVGIHHTVRLVVLTLAFPLILRLFPEPDHQATGSRYNP